MANEDCNNSSVLGDALKIAAVGFGAYKGGKSLVKHYDDLGATILGEKLGGSMSKGIGKALNAFEGEGGNKVREGIDKLQGKILDHDFKKGVNKVDSLLNKDGIEMTQKNMDEIHEGYSSLVSPSEKREGIRDIKNMRKEKKELRQEYIGNYGKDEGIKSYKEELLSDTESFAPKGTKEAGRSESKTQKL